MNHGRMLTAAAGAILILMGAGLWPHGAARGTVFTSGFSPGFEFASAHGFACGITSDARVVMLRNAVWLRSDRDNSGLRIDLVAAKTQPTTKADADHASDEHGKKHSTKTQAQPKGHDKQAAHGQHAGTDVAAAVALLRKIHPRLADQIEKLNKEHPQKAQQMLQKHYHWVGWLLQMQKHDPKMFQLRLKDIIYTRDSQRLARQLKSLRHAGNDKHHDKNAKSDHPRAATQPTKDHKGDAKANDARRAALIKRLRAVLEKQFAVRQQIRQHELSELEDHIEQLRKQLKSRSDRKEKLIDHRLKDLVGQGK